MEGGRSQVEGPCVVGRGSNYLAGWWGVCRNPVGLEDEKAVFTFLRNVLFGSDSGRIFHHLCNWCNFTVQIICSFFSLPYASPVFQLHCVAGLSSQPPAPNSNMEINDESLALALAFSKLVLITEINLFLLFTFHHMAWLPLLCTICCLFPHPLASPPLFFPESPPFSESLAHSLLHAYWAFTLYLTNQKAP